MRCITSAIDAPWAIDPWPSVLTADQHQKLAARGYRRTHSEGHEVNLAPPLLRRPTCWSRTLPGRFRITTFGSVAEDCARGAPSATRLAHASMPIVAWPRLRAPCAARLSVLSARGRAFEFRSCRFCLAPRATRRSPISGIRLDSSVVTSSCEDLICWNLQRHRHG